MKIACANAGIHRDTFYERLNTDPSFAQALAAEQRRVIRECLDAMRSTTREKDWRVHAWFLERVYRDDFGPPAIASAVGVQKNNVLRISVERAKEIRVRVEELEKRARELQGNTGQESKEDGHIKAEVTPPVSLELHNDGAPSVNAPGPDEHPPRFQWSANSP